jgi:type IV pilus assembly protein PilV
MAGVGLIEVLIAIAILAFGLLGIAALQATTLRNTQSAMERSQAVVQTYAILDRMRANVGVAATGGYDIDMCAKPVAGTLAGNDQAAWIDSLQDDLGASACGQISGCGTAKCVITVQWDDNRGVNAGDESKHQFKTETRL